MAIVTRFPLDGHRVRLDPAATRAAWSSDAGLHIVDTLRVPGAIVEELAWSPDGAYVAAIAAGVEGPGGRRSVRWLPAYLGDPSGSAPGAAFAWEPAGVGLIVADPWAGRIRRHCTETGRVQDVCALEDDGDPLQAPALAVAPDGRRVAFTRMKGNAAEVRIAELPSGTASLVTELPSAATRARPFWTPDSRTLGLLLVDLEAGRSAIVREKEILHASELILDPRPPAWSPSGRRLAFMDVERPHHEFTKAGPPRLAVLENGVRRALTGPGEVKGDVRWLDETRLVVDGEGSAWVVGI